MSHQARALPLSRVHRPASCCVRRNITRNRHHVVAYQADDRAVEMKEAVRSMPTVSNMREAAAVPSVCSNTFKYHTSFWYRELVDNHGRNVIGPGVEEYQAAVRSWQTAYPDVKEQQQVVAVGAEDAFLLSIYEVTNTGELAVAKPRQAKHLTLQPLCTGPFLGHDASNKTSRCAASYRFHFDKDGRVSDMWLYRTGTKEEHHSLVGALRSFLGAGQLADVVFHAPHCALSAAQSWGCQQHGVAGGLHAVPLLLDGRCGAAAAHAGRCGHLGP
jgi:hypothetical protein